MFQLQKKVRQSFDVHDPFGSTAFRIEVWEDIVIQHG